MTVEQFIGIMTALTALVGVVGAVVAQVMALRREVNGRMTHLLELQGRAEHRAGELEGRDYERAMAPPPPEEDRAP